MPGLEENFNHTPFGRITVIKSLDISKITHLLTNLPDPEENFLKELNKLSDNFIWNGKNDKIRRSGVCQALCVLAECCFTSTETVGLLETGAQDVHLDFSSRGS